MAMVRVRGCQRSFVQRELRNWDVCCRRLQEVVGGCGSAPIRCWRWGCRRRWSAATCRWTSPWKWPSTSTTKTTQRVPRTYGQESVDEDRGRCVRGSGRRRYAIEGSLQMDSKLVAKRCGLKRCQRVVRRGVEIENGKIVRVAGSAGWLHVRLEPREIWPIYTYVSKKPHKSPCHHHHCREEQRS